MKCLHTSVKPLHTIFADCPKSRNFAIPNPRMAPVASVVFYLHYNNIRI